MRSTANFQILKKQERGDIMKLCDVLILIGMWIVLLSVEILVCSVVYTRWGIFDCVIMGIAAIGFDFMVIGFIMIE